MNRRHFLQSAGFVSASQTLPFFTNAAGVVWAATPTPTLTPTPNAKSSRVNTPYNNLLILIELKGANDGLNTVVPFTDPNYAKLRRTIALEPNSLLALSEREAMHPALKPLLPLWENKELAVVQGLGYPSANLSHFRSIEIWDTASKSDEYLAEGWLSRTFAGAPIPASFAADGVVVGSNDMGPLAGHGGRTIALTDTAQFLRSAKLAKAGKDERNNALKHILSVETEIVNAASKLNTNYAFKTEFPKNAFAAQIRTAAQLAASNAGIATIRLSLSGFDTHANQLGTHANLLANLSEGIAALKSALTELGRWDSTLIMTYAEFGRRPKENQSGGCDHGTANVHFVAGGRVKGGLYGEAPQLNRLDGNGNLPFAVDFRSMYSTIINQWWGQDASRVLNGKFAPVDFLKT